MKKIGSLLSRKKLMRPSSLDPETIFYVFKQVIKEEYGKQGSGNIKPIFFRDRKVFVKTGNENWENELLENKKMVVERINQHLGCDEIIDLTMSR